jgi:hypothetical protein
MKPNNSITLIFLIILNLLTKNDCFSQVNLVPNSSFEDTLLISGQNFYLEHHITNWNGGRGYFNANQVGSFGSVPSNDAGHQYPRTGNAYCGIYTYLKNTYPIRQYIQTKLNQKLVNNKKYKVSFYVSLGDTLHAFCNSIGAYFTADSSDIFIGGVLNQIPQIQNSVHNNLSDKTNWTLVCDTFVANGNESWITICNFYNDSISNPVALDSVCSMPNGWGCGAYYYIDDVSVELVDETGISPTNLPKREAFKVVPNPATSVVNIEGKQSFTSIEIYNAQGYLVEQINTKPILNYKLSIINYNKGIYILKITDKNGAQCLKLVVE